MHIDYLNKNVKCACFVIYYSTLYAYIFKWFSLSLLDKSRVGKCFKRFVYPFVRDNI